MEMNEKEVHQLEVVLALLQLIWTDGKSLWTKDEWGHEYDVLRNQVGRIILKLIQNYKEVNWNDIRDLKDRVYQELEELYDNQ